jgi:hypothetical protein
MAVVKPTSIGSILGIGTGAAPPVTGTGAPPPITVLPPVPVPLPAPLPGPQAPPFPGLNPILRKVNTGGSGAVIHLGVLLGEPGMTLGQAQVVLGDRTAVGNIVAGAKAGNVNAQAAAALLTVAQRLQIQAIYVGRYVSAAAAQLILSGAHLAS